MFNFTAIKNNVTEDKKEQLIPSVRNNKPFDHIHALDYYLRDIASKHENKYIQNIGHNYLLAFKDITIQIDDMVWQITPTKDKYIIKTLLYGYYPNYPQRQLTTLNKTISTINEMQQDDGIPEIIADSYKEFMYEPPCNGQNDIYQYICAQKEVYWSFTPNEEYEAAIKLKQQELEIEK